MSTNVEHQPRERAAPCTGCGYTFDRSGIPQPRTWTWAVSALCPRHEKSDDPWVRVDLNKAPF